MFSRISLSVAVAALLALVMAVPSVQARQFGIEQNVPITAGASHNSHQDHHGACARSTTNINKGVGDLKFNGVLGSFAKSFGINAFDGKITPRMEQQLVVGELVSAITTNNEGCDGHGNTFPAGKRKLRKREKVIVRAPARYADVVCQRKSSSCHAVRITVTVVAPASCWNRNRRKKIEVWIWIKNSPTKATPTTKIPLTTTAPPTTTTPPCQVTVHGDNNGVICGGTQICTANGKYSGDVALCNAYISCLAIQGNTWNSEQNVCVHQSSGCSNCQPPVCPNCGQPDCQTCQPPSDHAPGFTWTAFPHLYNNAGAHGTIYVVASDEDFDMVTFDAYVTADTSWLAYISGIVEVHQSDDQGTPCPVLSVCFAATLWVKQGQFGFATIVGIVSANGVSVSHTTQVEVVKDEF